MICYCVLDLYYNEVVAVHDHLEAAEDEQENLSRDHGIDPSGLEQRFVIAEKEFDNVRQT